MLITDTHTDTQTQTHTHRPNYKNVFFGFRGASKSVKPSKSPLRKYDPKPIFSLVIGKRK